MSYVCFNRIAVSRPGPKVPSSAPTRAEGAVFAPKMDHGDSVAFSLERLSHKNCLPGPSSACIPFDAWHYLRAGPMAAWHGYALIVYGLEVKNYEVYELLTPLSRVYTDLCFVDSQISLDSGEIMAACIPAAAAPNGYSPKSAAVRTGSAPQPITGSPSSKTPIRTTTSEGRRGRHAGRGLAHWDKRVLRTLRR